MSAPLRGRISVASSVQSCTCICVSHTQNDTNGVTGDRSCVLADRHTPIWAHSSLPAVVAASSAGSARYTFA